MHLVVMLVLVIVLILRVVELMKVVFISDRDFTPSINSGNLFTPSSTKTTGSRSKKVSFTAMYTFLNARALMIL
jgi:hypothetical protein